MMPRAGQRATAPRRSPSAAAETAEVRSVAYALFSQLIGSPAGAERAADVLPPSDLEQVAASLEKGLPYSLELGALVTAARGLGAAHAQRLATEYGRLFEVGSDGPPVPLREELVASRPGRAKEEVVRYYSYFGYTLLEARRWAPDHLAIELEFLHFLAFREAAATASSEGAGMGRSYRLGQLDFLERHPLAWIGEVRAGVAEHAAEPYHRLLFEALGDFLGRDHDWLTRATAGGA